MDREAWQAAVHSVAELSWTRLSPLALIFNLSSFFFVVCSQHACVHMHTHTHPHTHFGCWGETLGISACVYQEPDNGS